MPVIRRLEAESGLEIGSAPNPQLDASAARAAGQLGGATAGLGQDIGAVAQHWAAREQQREDFASRIRLSKVQQDIAAEDQEAALKMPADGSGWLEARQKAASEKLTAYIGALPPRLQEEFKQRADLTLGGLKNAYARQELQQRSTWAVDGINTTAEGAANQVFVSPEQLEAQRTSMRDLISSSPIPQETKIKLQRGYDESLEIAAVRGLAQRDPEAAKRALGVLSGDDGDGAPAAPNGPPGSGGRARAMGARERGASIKAYYESQGLSQVAAAALGGHAIQESRARSDGPDGDSGTSSGIFQWRNERRASLQKFAASRGENWKDSKTQLEFARWEGENGDAGARRAWREIQSATTVEEAVTAWMHFERPQGYTPENPRGGHAYASRLSNAKALLGKSGAEIEVSTATGSAQTALGEPAPSFGSISYEKRVALVGDIDRTERAATMQAAAAAKTEYQGQLNQLQLDVIDGKAGLTEVHQARVDGWLTDADDVNKVMSAIATRDKEVNATQDAFSALGDSAKTWDPTDADDKKRVDRLFDVSNGASKMAANDQHFVQAGLLPLLDRTGMVPKSARGALLGMMRSQSTGTLNAGMAILDQIDRRNPQAFARDMGADAAKKLELWRERRAYDTPDAIAQILRRVDDPSERRAREDLEKDGLKLAADVSDGDILSKFDNSWFSDPQAPADPITNGALRGEFDTLFAEQYALTGDKALAKDQALRRLSTVWAISPTSGGRVMKNAPERLLPSIEGSHAWLRDQLQKDLTPVLGTKTPEQVVGGKGGGVRIPAGVSFDIDKADPVLVSDDRTEALVANQQRPSYGVTVKNADGILTPVRDAQNRAMRITFDPKPYEQALRDRLSAADAEAKAQAKAAAEARDAASQAQRGSYGRRPGGPNAD